MSIVEFYIFGFNSLLMYIFRINWWYSFIEFWTTIQWNKKYQSVAVMFITDLDELWCFCSQTMSDVLTFGEANQVWNQTIICGYSRLYSFKNNIPIDIINLCTIFYLVWIHLYPLRIHNYWVWHVQIASIRSILDHLNALNLTTIHVSVLHSDQLIL